MSTFAAHAPGHCRRGRRGAAPSRRTLAFESLEHRSMFAVVAEALTATVDWQEPPAVAPPADDVPATVAAVDDGWVTSIDGSLWITCFDAVPLTVIDSWACEEPMVCDPLEGVVADDGGAPSLADGDGVPADGEVFDARPEDVEFFIAVCSGGGSGGVDDQPAAVTMEMSLEAPDAERTPPKPFERQFADRVAAPRVPADLAMGGWFGLASADASDAASVRRRPVGIRRT